MNHYRVELEAVDLKSFARFVNRHWRTERLEARQASGGDDIATGWQLWSYGGAIGQLTAQQLRTDRLRVRLLLDDDDDETLPFGEPDDPEPWHARNRIDWILEFARGWLKYHYGADLVPDDLTGTPAPTPQAGTEPAPAGSGDQVTGLTPDMQDWLFIIRQAEYERTNHGAKNAAFCTRNGLSYDTFRKNKWKLKESGVLAWTQQRPRNIDARVIEAIRRKREQGWKDEPEILE